MTDAPINIPHILSEHAEWLCGDGGTRADLQGADLRNADLQGAYLQGANLRNANLQGANLQGADLQDAYLQGANLRNANLQGADLRNADFRGADFRGADLQGAYLIDGGQRSDGYRFVGWIRDDALMIRAGCRNLTLAEYREHNASRDNAALRDETTAILDHIERVATIRELVK